MSVESVNFYGFNTVVVDCVFGYVEKVTTVSQRLCQPIEQNILRLSCIACAYLTMNDIELSSV